MDSGLDAIVLLDIELGEVVVIVHRSVADITQSGSINNVPHGKTLDSLVLRDGLRGRDASVLRRR